MHWNRSDQQEERISSLEDRIVEIISVEEDQGLRFLKRRRNPLRAIRLHEESQHENNG